MDTEKRELMNTIKVAAQPQDMDFALVPAGKRTMGLISITNVKLRPFKPGDPEEDGYQFTFRDREITNGFVNVRVAAKTGNERANLVRLMKNMTDGSVTEKTSPEEMFTAMQICLNSWYEVRVRHNQGKDKHGAERTYANIDEMRADPARVDLPPPSEYFNEVMDQGGDPVVTGASNGHNAYYSLAKLSDETKKKAILLLEGGGATRCNDGDNYWRSPKPIDKLAKLQCSEDEALDDIPF